MKKGVFITLEGPEGAGKSTIAKLMENYLEENGIQYVSTREPGGISISEQIRNIILKKENTSMDSITEALLYAAARRQHLLEKVVPALEEGKIVLCDRFIDSSFAYQGYARGIGLKKVIDINSFAVDKYMPDITLYIDIEPMVGLERISKNKSREINRIDLEKLEFHNKVREGYLKLLEIYPDRIIKINGEQSLDKVFDDVKNILEVKFKSLFLKN